MITKANQIIADSLSIISNAENLAQNASTVTLTASMIPTADVLTSSINTPTIPVTITNPIPPSIP